MRNTRGKCREFNLDGLLVRIQTPLIHLQDAEDEDSKEDEEPFRKGRPQVPYENPFSGCDHDHSEERRIFELSTPEKLDLCRRYKNLGNIYLREGQFERASVRYQQSMIYHEYIISEKEEEEDEANQIQLQCLANMAICCLQLGEFRKTIQLCSQALQGKVETSLLTKILYRRAQAHRHLGEYMNASGDLTEAMKANPNSKTLQQETQRLQMETVFHKKQQQELATKVFNKKGDSKV